MAGAPAASPPLSGSGVHACMQAQAPSARTHARGLAHCARKQAWGEGGARRATRYYTVLLIIVRVNLCREFVSCKVFNIMSKRLLKKKGNTSEIVKIAIWTVLDLCSLILKRINGSGPAGLITLPHGCLILIRQTLFAALALVSPAGWPNAPQLG